MLLADIAEARWRAAMADLVGARTLTALAAAAGIDRPRLGQIVRGDRLPSDRNERRALLDRVFDALQAPANARLELGILAGTVEWLPYAPAPTLPPDAHDNALVSSSTCVGR